MFLSPRADSGDRSPWGSFWFSALPFRSGGPVNADQAMRLTAAYRCVRLLADTIAMLPLQIYKPQDDGGRRTVTDHWLHRLLTQRPNEWQNPVEYRQMMDAHCEMRGNAYSQIVSNRLGEVTDLIPLHPDRVCIEMVDDNNWRYRYTRKDGSYVWLNRQQVFHMKYFTLDGIVGVNPIQLASDAIGTGLEAQDYGRRFFQNDGRPNGWIEHPTKFSSDEQRGLWRQQWQEQQSGANRGKVAVLEFGMKFHEIQLSNVDAQLIESKRYAAEDVCRLWGVPPHKVGMLDRSTNNNIEQQSLDFIADAVLPRAICWASAIQFNLLQPEEGLSVDLITRMLQMIDSLTLSNYLQKLVLSGVLTRNEARLHVGMNPLPGLDEPLRPLNTAPESEAADAAQNAQDQPDSTGQQQPKPRGPGDARLNALAGAAADRVARKEAELVAKASKTTQPEAALRAAYGKHAEFVSEALAVPLESAQRYCQQQLALASVAHKQLNGEFAHIARMRLAQLASGIEDHA